jgi:hypothetical protein
MKPWLQQARGSALILTMLILLVLSAIGMVALADVGRSVKQSGVYRVRAQAQNFSEAAAEYVVRDSGERADAYWNMMERGQMNSLDGMAIGNRLATSRRGAFVRLDRDRDGTGHFNDLRADTDWGETGLLTNGTKSSFEAREGASEFSVIIRDPLDGPPAPGYSDRYCFKKVTIASRGFVGEPDPEWTGAGMMAERRNAVETFIGPIECGSQ